MMKAITRVPAGRSSWLRALSWPAIVVAAMAVVVVAQPPEPPNDPPPERPRDVRDRPRDGEGPRGFGRGRLRDRPGGFDRNNDEAAIPPEMVDWMMEFVQQKFPERYERLTALRERNPRRFQQLLRRMIPVMREYTKIRERRPDVAETIITEFRTQQQLDELGTQYRAAAGDAEKQKQIEAQMEPLVRKQLEGLRDRVAFHLEDFDRRLKQQQQRLAEQRARFDQEVARFEEHVARRLDQIKSGKPGEPFAPFGERPRPPRDGFGPGGPHGPGRGEGPGPGRGPGPGMRRPLPGEPPDGPPPEDDPFGPDEPPPPDDE